MRGLLPEALFIIFRKQWEAIWLFRLRIDSGKD